jgi:pilus assembly protein CpaC
MKHPRNLASLHVIAAVVSSATLANAQTIPNWNLPVEPPPSISVAQIPQAPTSTVREIGSRASSNTQPVQLQPGVVEIVDPARAPLAAATPAAAAAPSRVQIIEVPASSSPGRTTGVSATSSAPKAGAQAAQVDAMPATDVLMQLGESRLVRGLRASRVVVGTDKVASAVVLDNREVMLFGNAPGSTTLQIWDTRNAMRTFRVIVKGTDIAKMAADVRTMLSDIPGVKVAVLGDKVVIDGQDLGDENLHRIAALTKQFDNVVNLTEYQRDNGGWDRMVILDVKIVEFKNRDHVRQLGIDWSINGAAGPSFGIVGDIKASRNRDGTAFVLPTQGLPSGVQDLARPAAPFRTFFGLASAVFSKINLLASDGEAVILSEPQLAARHGRSARMNVGGRVPITVAGVGVAQVVHERFGVIVEMTPHIGKNGMVHAKIKAEVSEPISALAPTAGLTERMVETVFNVNDGETMVLSGLVTRKKVDNVNKVPLLGDAPIFGSLFRTEGSSMQEGEVVIFVTPKIVDPKHRGIVDTVNATERRLDDALGPMHMVPGGAR